MSEIIKIALTGKMRSGKDTVGDYLHREKGFYAPIAFGDALKHFAHEIFPDVPLEPKPRELYQFMNVMREFDPDVWVKHLANRVEVVEEFSEAIKEGGVAGIVVTDARQPNEVEWLRDNGFVIVKVEADEATRVERIKAQGESVSAEALRHKTELFVDEIHADYVIENDGSLGELKAKVDELLAELTKGER